MNEKMLTRILLIIVFLGLLFMIVTDKSLAERFDFGQIQGPTYAEKQAAPQIQAESVAPAPLVTVVVVEKLLPPCTGESVGDCYRVDVPGISCIPGQCPDDNK